MSDTLTLTPDELRAWDLYASSAMLGQTIAYHIANGHPNLSESSPEAADRMIRERRKRTAEAPVTVPTADLYAMLDRPSNDALVAVVRAIRAATGVNILDAQRMVDAVRNAPTAKNTAPRGGWRLLEEGEVIAEGDECWNLGSHQWQPCNVSVGQVFNPETLPPNRRRMEARDA